MKSLVKTANKRNLREDRSRTVRQISPEDYEVLKPSQSTFLDFFGLATTVRPSTTTSGTKTTTIHAQRPFGVWKRRNQVLDDFFKKVSGGDNSVLWAYGDASLLHLVREETVPVKRRRNVV
jgi:hypothetical protein